MRALRWTDAPPFAGEGGRMRTLLCCVLLSLLPAVTAAQVTDYKVEGDGIPKSLTGKPGVAARGKALLAKRQAANCLDCHSVNDKELGAGGTKGPALDGIGAVLTPAQLRLSVVDIARVNPKAGMPSFHKADGLLKSDAPRLTPQEVEDVVAYLSSLKR
jgi:sulfur-oxidizing protein SoxX